MITLSLLDKQEIRYNKYIHVEDVISYNTLVMSVCVRKL